MSLDLSTVQEVLNKIRSSGTRLYHANRDEYWTESFAINKTEQVGLISIGLSYFSSSRREMGCARAVCGDLVFHDDLADIATAFDFILSDLSDIMKLLKGKGYYVSVSDVIVSGYVVMMLDTVMTVNTLINVYSRSSNCYLSIIT